MPANKALANSGAFLKRACKKESPATLINDSTKEVVNFMKEVDARGLSCPLPLLKAKQALNQMQPGESLKVLATDVGSVRDFQSFSELSGNPLLERSEEDGCYIYILQKA
ncbi:sulfurtransferase TusA family protein [Pseudomaricurvus sp.]|uniref:sulfurtransferase TusA family protein n=1 Tax=Pseudomaricurvus sp. TaxID=2004510 RepID=UPI003F6CE593